MKHENFYFQEADRSVGEGGYFIGGVVAMIAPGVLAFLFILVDASDKDKQHDVFMSGLVQCEFYPV